MSRHRLSGTVSRRDQLIAAVAAVVAALAGTFVLLVSDSTADDPGSSAAASGFGSGPTPGPPDSPSPERTPEAPDIGADGVDREAWPGPATTGVPDGVTLTPYTGPTRIEEAGTVIDSKLIQGCLEIVAPDVLIRQSKIECGGMMVETYTWEDPNASVTIEDTEMDGLETAAVIQDGNYTLRRVNVHNINEGPRIGDNVVIEDSWLHDLVFSSWDDHQDLLQTVGGTNVVIRGNYLDARSDPVYFSNAVFQVGAEFGPTRDFLFEDNFVDGGGYSINIRDDPGMENLVFQRNLFGRHAEYGPATMGPNTVGVTWDTATNVYADTGEPVPL